MEDLKDIYTVYSHTKHNCTYYISKRGITITKRGYYGILHRLACYTGVHVKQVELVLVFGAPTGSVNSFFINERKKWYSCEHSSCLLQKIITCGSLHLEVFSFMSNRVKASSILTF